MGLNSDELALLTALISASFSEEAEDKLELRAASGLAHTRFNGAIKALEGRGLVTRHRTAARGNGRTWRLHREPVPENERTGETPEAKKPRTRNAEQLKRKESTDGRPSVEESNEETQENPTSNDVRMDVHPQTDVRMDVHQPATDGRPSALPIQTFTDTSSSLGSSSTGEHGVGKAEEEDEENSKREELEQTARRLASTIRPHLEPSGKFLLPEARERVVEMLARRLEEGHREEFLEAQLRLWSKKAINPSYYLPMQLDELGPPRPDLRVVRTESQEASKQEGAEPREETLARAREIARNIGSRPRVHSGRAAHDANQETGPLPAHEGFEDFMNFSTGIINSASEDQKHA